MPSYNVPIGLNAYERTYSGEAVVRVLNRFVEATGVNQIENRAMLARPPSRLLTLATGELTGLGEGPLRGLFHSEGTFTNDMFAVSGAEIYRIKKDGTINAISGFIGGSGEVSMDVVSLPDATGRGKKRLWIADGLLLQYYEGGTSADGYFLATPPAVPDIWLQVLKIGDYYYAWGDPAKPSQATLTLSNPPGNDETVTIGSVVYTWKTTLTGAADEIKIGTTEGSIDNLVAAINAAAGEGTTYGTGTVEHPQVTAEKVSAASARVLSKNGGLAANFIGVDDTDMADGVFEYDTMFGAGDETKTASNIFDLSAGNAADGETVRVGATTYTFRTEVSLSTSENKVLIGADAVASLYNLYTAITQPGRTDTTAGVGSGTLYMAGIERNVQARAKKPTSTQLTVQARDWGSAGNSVITTEVSTNGAWLGGTTMSGAQDGTLRNPFLTPVGDTDQISLLNMASLLNSDTDDVSGQVAVTTDQHAYTIVGEARETTGPGRVFVIPRSELASYESIEGWHVATQEEIDAATRISHVPPANPEGGIDGSADVSPLPVPQAAVTAFLVDELTLRVIATVTGAAGEAVVTEIVPAGDAFLAWDAAALVLAAGATLAAGSLRLSPTLVQGDVIEAGGIYYAWGDPTTAGQTGASGTQWLAATGTTLRSALENVAKVINFDGVRGEDFSEDLSGAHTLLRASVDLDDDGLPQLIITALSEETDGNAITISVETDTTGVLSVSGATLSGGGVHALQGAEVPDGRPPGLVVSISGYVIVAINNSQRFYWVRPGEIVIDPLDFAEAEFAPDNITDAVVVADQLWLGGASAIEVWYVTGDANDAFRPISGRAYAHGVVAGTMVRSRDTVFFVGPNGVVYAYGGTISQSGSRSGMQPISTHGIEERLRKQLTREAQV